MSDTSFNDVLDAMVRGERLPDSLSATERFAIDLYQQEGNARMPASTKTLIAEQLGLTQLLLATHTPVSTRAARLARDEHKKPATWTMFLGIAAAILILVASAWQLGMITRDNGSNQPQTALNNAAPTLGARLQEPHNANCEGDCGGYQAILQPADLGTPVASPASADWLTPVRPEECPLDQTTVVGPDSRPVSWSKEDYLQQFPDRQYQPYGEPSAAESEAVALRWRQSQACEFHATRSLPIMSPRFYFENRTMAGLEEVKSQNLEERQRTEGEALSTWLMDERGVTVADILLPDIELESIGMRNVTNPDAMIKLADGRIAMIPVYLLTESQTEEGAADSPRVMPHAVIWMEYEGQWYVDETLPLCIGTCEDVWNPGEATPDASPEAHDPLGLGLNVLTEQIPTPTAND